MAYKPYTMIGSRQTPQDILDLMVKLASKLATEGYTVRSGGADGADTCAEQGVDSLGTEYSHMKEIYLPWRGFNGRYNKFPPYYIADKLDGYKKAREIAEETHPAWDRCSDGAKSLHTRNVMQVLGKDVDTPSLFVVFWAVPKSGTQVSGGTNTAVQLAIKHGVKTINLYHEHERLKIVEYLNK